ncbi:TPA: phage tail protein, partial [Klebsiella oxytoca]|nr:phage tail protein [Klebsiella oxytoca]
MATQNKQAAQDIDLDKVSVIVGGKVHSDWSGYSIDSDFLIPADAWSMRLGLPAGIFP